MALLPLVVVLVRLVVPVEPVAAPEAPAAGALAPTAPLEVPVAGTLALTEAPAGDAEPLVEEVPVVVVVVEVLVGLAARMSMNTTVWPLLARFKKVPAVAGMADDEVPPVELLLEVDVPLEEPVLEPELLLAANEPVHWLGLSIC